MSKKYDDIALIEIVPGSISGDSKIQALAEGADSELKDVQDNIQSVYILSRIDTLPEPVIDLLAWQLHVDFWDSGLNLTRKRNLVKNSIKAHRIKGTPGAIETVLDAIGHGGVVSEWFEYGDDPYYFKVSINAGDDEITTELSEKITKWILFYKNTRSWLRDVEFFYLLEPEISLSAGNVGKVTVDTVFNNLIQFPSSGTVQVTLGAVGAARVTATMS